MSKPAVPIVTDLGSPKTAMMAFCAAGERQAMSLGNRGPIRFTANGALHLEILEAYSRHDLYVFQGALKADELADINADFRDIQARLPALGVGLTGLNLV